MKINDKDREILFTSVLGFEFEFYSKMDANQTKRSLSKILGKKILIFEKVHSDFKPTAEVFKLEPDYSGGRKMMELITGPLSYMEAKLIMIKTLSWIRENGETTDRCSFQFNVSFDTKKYGNSFVAHMNPLKFILDFDEEMVYQEFPQRKNSVYAKSIKFIVPKSKFYMENEEDLKNISPDHFLIPYTKYYGINFSKLTKGYLEFRYIGGKNYEYKEDKIAKIMDDTISILYQSIMEKTYSDANHKQIGKIYEKHSKLIYSYKSYDNFRKIYPKIKFTVDLNSDKRIVSIYYANIRDRLFEILSESSLNIGLINYDSDKGRIQIKDAKMDPCYMLKEVDLVNCRVKGNIEACSVFASEIVDSDIVECNLYGETNIYYSKIKNSYMGRNCKAEKSYVFGPNSIINGEMDGGILREGKLTKEAKISPNTEVVEYKKI